MSAFGENLKKEREARGISLQEISDHTRIGVRQLKAVEEEQLDQLPGGIFNKSFVRQYARYLGLDEDRIVAEYVKALGASPEAATGGSSGLSHPSYHTPSHAPASFSADTYSAERRSSEDTGYPRLILTAIGVGFVVAVVVYGIHEYTAPSVSQSSRAVSSQYGTTGSYRETPNAPSSPSGSSNSAESNPSVASAVPPRSAGQTLPAQNSPAAGVGPAGGGESPPREGYGSAGGQSVLQTAAPQRVRDAGAASDAAAGSVALQIDARKVVWLSITADGQKQWQGTLEADQSRRVEARDTVRLIVGDAGAVAITLNGKMLPSVGHSGEVKNLTISAKGLAESAR